MENFLALLLFVILILGVFGFGFSFIGTLLIKTAITDVIQTGKILPILLMFGGLLPLLAVYGILYVAYQDNQNHFSVLSILIASIIGIVQGIRQNV